MELVPFGDLCTMSGRNADYTHTSDFVDQCEGIIVLTPSNIRDEKVFYDDVVYLSKNTFNKNNTGIVNKGDILLSKYAKSESPYRSALVDNLPDDATVIVNQSIFVISGIKCVPKYLQQVITSYSFQKALHSIATGSMGAVKSSEIAKIMVPFLDEEEQMRIADMFIDYKYKHFELIDLLQREIDDRNKVFEQLLDNMIWEKIR